MTQTALPGLQSAETPYQGARPYRPISARLDQLYIRRPRLFLMLIVAAYLIVGSLFAVTTPPGRTRTNRPTTTTSPQLPPAVVCPSCITATMTRVT